MPAGPSLLGIGYYCAVKASGYTAAAAFLRPRAAIEPDHRSLTIGISRTLIGIFFGVSVLSVLSAFSLDNRSWIFFAALIPVRILEWWILFSIFFRRSGWGVSYKLKYACLGVLWSFVLDVPAFVAAFTLPGGFWVC